MIKIYIYDKCSTCRNAIRWLNENKLAHEPHPVRETPPDIDELKHALRHMDGEIRRLFNTSGMDYRAMKLKDLLPKMSVTEALELLSRNGNLVKRPLVIGNDLALAGFKPDQWEKALC